LNWTPIVSELAVTLPDEQDISEALETDLNQVANLEKNRAWISLKGYLYERRRVEQTKLVKAIFRKNAEPVDQRAIDYARGVIDTLEWMLTLPERVKRAQS
jgi:hypothetical protein